MTLSGVTASPKINAVRPNLVGVNNTLSGCTVMGHILIAWPIKWFIRSKTRDIVSGYRPMASPQQMLSRSSSDRFLAKAVYSLEHGT